MLLFLLSAGSARARPAAPSGLPVELEWTWSLVGDEPGRAGLILTDFDSDGRAEIFASNRHQGLPWPGYYWYELEYGADVRQVWSSLPFSDDIVHLSADTRFGKSILIATQSDVLVYDGATRQLERVLSSVGTSISGVRLTDLDGDREAELLICEEGGVSIFDFETAQLVASAPGFPCSAIDSAQSDSDPQEEILVLSNHQASVLDGTTLAVEWSEPTGIGLWARLLDIDRDGVAELVCRAQDYPELRALELPSGKPVWEGTLNSQVEALTPVTPVGADTLQLIVATSETIHSIQATTGSANWSFPVSTRNFYALGIADVDGDGSLELVWSGEDSSGLEERVRFTIADLDSQTIEARTIDLGPALWDASVRDIDRDGRPEILVATNRDSFHGDIVILDEAGRQVGILQPAGGDEGPGGASSLAVGQAAPDAAQEICAIGGIFGSEVGCLDSITREVEWGVRFPGQNSATSLLIGTPRHGETASLLVGSIGGFVWSLAGPSGWLQWRSDTAPASGAAVTDLAIGDVDGDADPEIVGFAPNLIGFSVVIVDPSSGFSEYGPFDVVCYFGSRSFTLGQVDSDPELEIVTGCEDGTVSVFDPVVGSLEPPLATYDGDILSLLARDFDGDGTVDLAVWAGDRVHIRSGADGTEIWTSPYLGPPSGVRSLHFTNSDSDLDWELLAAARGAVIVFEVPFPGFFADGFESGDTSEWSQVQP